jgi:hypothetical protein
MNIKFKNLNNADKEVYRQYQHFKDSKKDGDFPMAMVKT